MTPYNLAVGVGLPTGEVIEGSMDSDTIRAPAQLPPPVTPRILPVKSKADQLQAFAIHP